MSKLVLLILISLLITKAKGQDLTSDDLIGVWKVVKIELTRTTKESKEQLKVLEPAFMKSKFELKKDENFNFPIDFSDIAIKNAHWRFNSFTNTILVQEWKDKNSKGSLLMEIQVIKVGEKTYFLLTESPFKIEVIKQ